MTALAYVTAAATIANTFQTYPLISPHNDQASTIAFTGETVSSVPASVAEAQLQSWVQVGGGGLVGGFGSTLLAYDKAIPILGNAPSSKTVAAFDKRMSTTCAATTRTVNDTRAFFDVPIAAGQALWRQVVVRFQSFVHACTAAIRPRATVGDLTKLSTDAQSASHALLTFEYWSRPFLPSPSGGKPGPTPGSPVTVRLTGEDLQGLLLPASSFGSDFQMLANYGKNSSTTPEPKTPRFSASAPCQQLVGTFGYEGFGERSYADSTTLDPKIDLYYTQQVYEFDSAATARRTYDEVSTTMRGCKTGVTTNYSDGEAPTRMTYAIAHSASPSGIGRAALSFDLVGRVGGGVEYSEQLLAVDGAYVYSVSIAALSPDELKRSPTIATVARQLVAGFTAAS